MKTGKRSGIDNAPAREPGVDEIEYRKGVMNPETLKQALWVFAYWVRQVNERQDVRGKLSLKRLSERDRESVYASDEFKAFKELKRVVINKTADERKHYFTIAYDYQHDAIETSQVMNELAATGAFGNMF